MKTTDKNLVMVDYSELDPRSFKAHFRGGGTVTKRYYDSLLEKMGDSDLEAVDWEFRRTVQQEYTADRARRALQTPKTKLNIRAWMVSLFQAAVGLASDVMVYQTWWIILQNEKSCRFDDCVFHGQCGTCAK